MSWRAVAYRDVHTASRSKTIWLVFGLLLAVFVSFTGVHTYLGEDSFQAYLEGLAGVIGVFLPLVAILLGYKSIVHERASGSLALSLSLPHSRRDLLVGTVVGRAIVLLAPTLVALVVAGVVGVVLYGTDGLLLYPWFLLVTALYGLAFLGIAIGISTYTPVERTVSLGALGGYLLLVMLWDNVHSLTLVVLHRFNFDVLAAMPDWALLFRLVKPSEAYYRLLRAGFDVDLAGAYVTTGAPVYVGWWMALAVLVGWISVPPVVGYLRFRRADL